MGIAAGRGLTGSYGLLSSAGIAGLSRKSLPYVFHGALLRWQPPFELSVFYQRKNFLEAWTRFVAGRKKRALRMIALRGPGS